MTRHAFDSVSFVFGLAFVALGAATLLTSQLPLSWIRPDVLVPLAALGAGLWLLASGVRRGRRDGAEPPDGDDR